MIIFKKERRSGMYWIQDEMRIDLRPFLTKVAWLVFLPVAVPFAMLVWWRFRRTEV